MRTIQASVLLSVLFLAACNSSGEGVVVGDEATGQLGLALQDYASEWDGYAEAAAFPGDGSDRVRLTLDADGNGFLRLGDEPLYGPPTEVDALYPPTFPHEGGFPTYGFRSGVLIPVENAKVEGGRLRLTVHPPNQADAWCALAGPEPVPGYECSAFTSLNRDDKGTGCFFSSDEIPETEISCAIMTQCNQCICQGDVCGSPYTDWSAELDGALSSDGTGLTGTLVGIVERVTVRLTRS